MTKLTKIGLIAALLASFSLTACGSKDKAEDNAESALVEQTQDLMSDDTDMDVESETAAFQETDTSNFQDMDSPEPTDSESASLDDSFSSDDSDLGATSSGVGH